MGWNQPGGGGGGDGGGGGGGGNVGGQEYNTNRSFRVSFCVCARHPSARAHADSLSSVVILISHCVVWRVRARVCGFR